MGPANVYTNVYQFRSDRDDSPSPREPFPFRPATRLVYSLKLYTSMNTFLNLFHIGGSCNKYIQDENAIEEYTCSFKVFVPFLDRSRGWVTDLEEFLAMVEVKYGSEISSIFGRNRSHDRVQLGFVCALLKLSPSTYSLAIEFQQWLHRRNPKFQKSTRTKWLTNGKRLLSASSTKMTERRSSTSRLFCTRSW